MGIGVVLGLAIVEDDELLNSSRFMWVICCTELPQKLTVGLLLSKFSR